MSSNLNTKEPQNYEFRHIKVWDDIMKRKLKLNKKNDT